MYRLGHCIKKEKQVIISKGPDRRLRIYSRLFINGFLFRTAHVEKDLRTQNSGVVVRGDDSTNNVDWFGVIKKIICVSFGKNQEVMLFECDWFDVPSSSRNQSRGYKKDQYGMIDVNTTIFRYKNDPYILATQAEVFYVRSVKQPNWSTTVKTKPRNLFAMPPAEGENNVIEADVDSFDVGYDEISMPHVDEDMMAWARNDIEGASGDVSTLEKAQADQIEVGSDDEESDDDDDTYINDGHMAPLVVDNSDDDDDFFI